MLVLVLQVETRGQLTKVVAPVKLALNSWVPVTQAELRAVMVLEIQTAAGPSTVRIPLAMQGVPVKEPLGKLVTLQALLTAEQRVSLI